MRLVKVKRLMIARACAATRIQFFVSTTNALHVVGSPISGVRTGRRDFWTQKRERSTVGARRG